MQLYSLPLTPATANAPHRCPPQVAEKLVATASNAIEKNGIKATKLFTHREDVDQLNQRELASLPGKEKRFWGEDSDSSMEQSLSGLCPVPKELVLKVGAQVMLAKNISVQEGLVNGARGVITGFDASRKGGECVCGVCACMCMHCYSHVATLVLMFELHYISCYVYTLHPIPLTVL